jgi:hypothetical protein
MVDEEIEGFDVEGEQGYTVAHSLHRLLTLPCVQMLLPPQSLQTLLCLPCIRRPPLPPHFCICFLLLPCVQIPLPPQSLQRYL